MKTLLSIFALTLALAFTGPAFAGDVTAAKTEADCVKAGGTWNATTKHVRREKDVILPVCFERYERGVGIGRRPRYAHRDPCMGVG